MTYILVASNRAILTSWFRHQQVYLARKVHTFERQKKRSSFVPSIMIIPIGVAWFVSSALLSTWANTTFLKFFGDPLLHTFIRFFGSALMGGVSLCLNGEVKIDEILNLMTNVVIPALLLWIANYANSYALKDAGITLTYVVKACIPVFTVFICKLQGQNFPLLIYISLLPICLGVALASVSDLNFSLPGLIAALVSALAQTCMNISIKSVGATTGYSGPKAFLGMAIVCTLATFPVIYGSSIVQGSSVGPIDLLIEAWSKTIEGDLWPVQLLVVAAFAYHCEYALNFVFVGFVSSVAFSVSDIARRFVFLVKFANRCIHCLLHSSFFQLESQSL